MRPYRDESLGQYSDPNFPILRNRHNLKLNKYIFIKRNFVWAVFGLCGTNYEKQEGWAYNMLKHAEISTTECRRRPIYLKRFVYTRNNVFEAVGFLSPSIHCPPTPDGKATRSGARFATDAGQINLFFRLWCERRQLVVSQRDRNSYRKSKMD